jgi:hypothetical protein
MSDYRHKRHHVSSLLYHIVCPAKDRRVIFDPEVDTGLRAIYFDIAQRYDIAFGARAAQRTPGPHEKQPLRAPLRADAAHAPPQQSIHGADRVPVSYGALVGPHARISWWQSVADHGSIRRPNLGTAWPIPRKERVMPPMPRSPNMARPAALPPGVSCCHNGCGKKRGAGGHPKGCSAVPLGRAVAPHDTRAV